MLPNKTHYTLADAAEIVHCKPSDLLHFAVQGKIALLTGVPDWVDVRVYDEESNSETDPFLMTPQLLVLAQSHCLKIEINGRTAQSDFPSGYFVGSSGELRKILPSYGRPEINHRWVFWRTCRDQLVNLLELIPERLFVMHSDLTQFIELKVKVGEETIPPKKCQANKSASKTTDCVASQQIAPIADAGNDALNEEQDQEALPLNKGTAKQRNTDQSNASIEPRARSAAILRLKQVMLMTGLSRSTIYDKINSKSPRFDESFPKQVSLGVGSVGWRESEVIAWIESRKCVVGK